MSKLTFATLFLSLTRFAAFGFYCKLNALWAMEHAIMEKSATHFLFLGLEPSWQISLPYAFSCISSNRFGARR